MVGQNQKSEIINRIGPKKKIAFVCSGGATKAGAFHLGVALALQEKGFSFKGGLHSQIQSNNSTEPSGLEISTYVGSSAGSVISAYLAAGYSLENIFSSFLGTKNSIPDPRHTFPKPLPPLTYQKAFKFKTPSLIEKFTQMSKLQKLLTGWIDGSWEELFNLDWLKVSGIFSMAGVEQYLREEVLFSNSFHDYIPDLFVVATQLNHSRKVVFGKHSFSPPPNDLSCQYNNDTSISDACAASMALPVVFSPYAITNNLGQTHHYIDGEIRDTLSTHVAVDNGADLVIASYTHQPYHMSPDSGSLTEKGLPTILIQSIYLLIEQKINNHIFNKQTQINALNAVSDYCKTEGISDKQRHRICEILQAELNLKMNVDTIYIHPSPQDTRLFFGDHFTFSTDRKAEIVKSGFRSAIKALKRYEFADHRPQHAIGTPPSEG
jgi:hypothetical protein